MFTRYTDATQEACREKAAAAFRKPSAQDDGDELGTSLCSEHLRVVDLSGWTREKPGPHDLCSLRVPLLLLIQCMSPGNGADTTPPA